MLRFENSCLTKAVTRNEQEQQLKNSPYMKKVLIKYILILLVGLNVIGLRAQGVTIKTQYKETAPNGPIYAEGKTFVMPVNETGPNGAFYREIKPQLSKWLGASDKFLLRNNKTIKLWLVLERALKERDTIQTDKMFWSYVVDAKKQQVTGLNVVFGAESASHFKLKYGSLPFKEDLPASITELIDRNPNLEFWYEFSSPCSSYNTQREEVILENIESKSLKSFKNDTVSYMCHLFFKRDQFYFQKPFQTLLKDIDLKVEDYYMLKTTENQVWGVLLKFSDSRAVFVWLVNIEASKDSNLPLQKIKGNILTIEQIDVKQQVTRIEQNLKRDGIYFPRYEEVVNLVYMF
jgi:hypothetical protein